MTVGSYKENGRKKKTNAQLMESILQFENVINTFLDFQNPEISINFPLSTLKANPRGGIISDFFKVKGINLLVDETSDDGLLSLLAELEIIVNRELHYDAVIVLEINACPFSPIIAVTIGLDVDPDGGAPGGDALLFLFFNSP